MGIFGHFEVFKGTLVILEIYVYFGHFRVFMVSFCRFKVSIYFVITPMPMPFKNLPINNDS